MNMIPDEGKYSLKRYKGIITTLIIAIVVFFALWRLDSVVAVANKYLGYISPVIYGVSIAYVLNPAVVYFERLLRARFMKAKSEKTRAKADRLAKNLSIAIVITLAIAAIVVLCLMIIPSMLESIIDLAKQIVPLINSLVDRIDKFTSAESRFGDSLQSVIEKVSSALQEWITTNLLPTAQSALEYITSSVAAVLVFLYNFLVGIIVAVYALAEKKNFVAVAKKLTYVLWNPKHANRVVDTARHGHEIFGGFLSGKLIDSLIVGILCFIFCVCTNMPYSLLISTIVGVTNIIPFFGPFIGGIPTTFIVLVVDPPKGVLFGIFIIILQQIDGNIIGAKILGNTTGMSEFWVTFSLLLFGGMFGFVGMMIGVPLFSVIYYLATVLVNEKAEKRGLETADEFYYIIDRYDTAAGEFVMMDENAAKKRRKPRKDGKEPIVKRIGNRFRRKK